MFGYTADPNDVRRAERLRGEFSPLSELVTPLIAHSISKANALALIERAGIRPPRSYAWGFPNANCLESGCGKAQSPRYWALHRKIKPKGFAETARIARKFGVRLAVLNGERIYIDDIPADYPTTEPVAPACDLLCSINAPDL